MKIVSSARLRHVGLLALWVAGTAFIPRDAGADGKLVPATVCQPLNQASESGLENPADVLERITNIRYSVNGRVLNQSGTRRLGVVCPIIRDNLKQPLNWIRVMYVDQFPDPPMPSADQHEVLECEVRAASGVATNASDSQRINSLTSKFDNPGTLPGTGSGFWQFGGLDSVGSGDDANNPNFVYTFSHYTLTCLIPPRANQNGSFSWIAGIMIDEP